MRLEFRFRNFVQSCGVRLGDGDRKEGVSRSCPHIESVKAKYGLGVFRDEQPQPPLFVTL